MNAAALLAFNTRKAALQRALWPASVKFQKTGDTVRNQINTTLVEGTEAGETHLELAARVKAVFGDLSDGEVPSAGFTPPLLSTFTVLSGSQADLVGKRYRVVRVLSAPGEPVFKCIATRLEE